MKSVVWLLAATVSLHLVSWATLGLAPEEAKQETFNLILDALLGAMQMR